MANNQIHNPTAAITLVSLHQWQADPDAAATVDDTGPLTIPTPLPNLVMSKITQPSLTMRVVVLFPVAD